MSDIELYSTYQELLAREEAKCHAEVEPLLPEATPDLVLSKADFLQSIALAQCILQDFLGGTLDEALGVFCNNQVNVEGDSHHFLGDLIVSISDVRSRLSDVVHAVDVALHSLQSDDEQRIAGSLSALSALAVHIGAYENMAKLYFALRTGLESGLIACVDGNPVSQQKLDYIDTLLSHPSNICDTMSEMLPQASAQLDAETSGTFSNSLVAISQAYERFLATKSKAAQVYESLRDHSALLRQMGLRSSRIQLAEARAAIIDEKTETESPEVKLIVFSDYIAFISDLESDKRSQMQEQAVPLWGISLNLDTVNHRADLDSIVAGRIASLRIVGETPDWLLQLRDAVELASATSPLLSSRPL